jgi:hypothetical protein
MTRLEDLREKYPVTQLELDPYPFRCNCGCILRMANSSYYHGIGNAQFSPRPEYEQRLAVYREQTLRNN